jgi:hypothetical protein
VIEIALFYVIKLALFRGRSGDFWNFPLQAGNFDPGGCGDFRLHKAPPASPLEARLERWIQDVVLFDAFLRIG